MYIVKQKLNVSMTDWATSSISVFLVFPEADMKLPCILSTLFLTVKKYSKSLKIKFSDISPFQKLMNRGEQDKNVD